MKYLESLLWVSFQMHPTSHSSVGHDSPFLQLINIPYNPISLYSIFTSSCSRKRLTEIWGIEKEEQWVGLPREEQWWRLELMGLLSSPLSTLLSIPSLLMVLLFNPSPLSDLIHLFNFSTSTSHHTSILCLPVRHTGFDFAQIVASFWIVTVER